MKKVNAKRGFFLWITTAVIILNSCKNPAKASSFTNYDDFETIHSDFKLQSKALENGKLLEYYKCIKK